MSKARRSQRRNQTAPFRRRRCSHRRQNLDLPCAGGCRQTTQQQAAQLAGKGGFGLVSQTMIEAKGFNAHDGTAILVSRG